MPHTSRHLPTLACALAVCLLVLPLCAWLALELGVWTMPGVRVAGVPLRAAPNVRALLQRTAQAWEAQSLTLQVGYHVFQPTRAELGWGLRVEDAQRAWSELGHSPNPLVSWRELWIGAFGGGHELSWRARTTEPAAVTRYLEHVREQVERLPIAGSVAPTGEPIAGLAGEALDTVAAQRAIERALVRGDTALTLATIVTPPPAGRRRFDRPLEHVSVLMRTQDTAYWPGSGRAQNIELAARKLDGTIMLPGAALSFNRIVGKRERARGFAPALELVAGELVEGVGGGVCQVAGTLHAAAFFAGLVVDEYHAHSRLNRLSYLPPGLDAMVAWPEHVSELSETRDMRLRNPYPFPVRVSVRALHAGSQNLLRVELFGAARPFPVEFRFRELGRVPFAEVQRLDPTLPKGETRVQQPGLEGLSIARQRTIFTPLGRFPEETRIQYPPVPRIVRIGAKLMAADTRAKPAHSVASR